MNPYTTLDAVAVPNASVGKIAFSIIPMAHPDNIPKLPKKPKGKPVMKGKKK
jgi:hypothetical protein